MAKYVDRAVNTPAQRLLAVMLILGCADQALTQKASELRVGQAEKLTIDGRLDEAAWKTADKIDGLTAVEPVQGAKPAVGTEVWVLADRKNLYIGVRCYDDPKQLSAFAVARDASLGSEDHVKIVLGPVADGRTGYVLAVNPRGARYDALVADRGESENPDWNGAWEARTNVDAKGWTLEVRVPVAILVFDGRSDRWQFNIERRVQRLLERSRWSTPRLDQRVTQLSRAGWIVGVPKFDLGLGVLVMPSVVARSVRSNQPPDDSDDEFDGSLDAALRITPELSAILTINSDFAEADVDRRQINLTRYLGTNPDLLAGYQMDEAAPRRWLFVRREHGVEDASGTNRWAVDHVFIDQDAVPTLVEVKRSSDTRIRREVVGQILEYGANAVSHWPSGALRASFEARCEAQGLDAHEELRSSLGGTIDDDNFWNRVEENLRAGHVRLLIAADQVPPELHRIVEFLNEQMSPAEVLALEVRQFVGDGGQILVPRILGSTMSARDRKAPPRGRETPWTPEEFVQRLENAGHRSEAETAQHLIDWAGRHRLRLQGGSGSKAATLYLSVDADGRELTPFCLYEGHGSGGFLQIQLDELGPVLERETAALEDLCEQFGQIPSVVIDPAKKYPGIKLSLLSERTCLGTATAAMERAVRAIREGAWR